MPRNLDHRVEIAFPVLDPRLQSEIREVLEVQLTDTAKAREIQIDGSSTRVRVAEGPAVRSQERLYGLVAAESRAS
jgi:polyphosphate kinase